MPETVTLEMTQLETQMVAHLIALAMGTEERGIEGWENRNDRSLDRLFAHLEVMTALGGLWYRLQVARGVDEETLRRALSEF